MRNRRRNALLCLALAWLILAAAPALAGQAQPPAVWLAPGPHAITELRLDWRDAARDRPVPAKLYRPVGHGPWPLVIFSHGLGGSRDGYAYLPRHWASHGLACLHVQHLGSDEAVWRGKLNPMPDLVRAANDPRAAMDRPRDMSFALDEVVRQKAAGADWALGLDPQRVGAAGHSFGGFTVLALAGQVYPLPGGDGHISLADPRFRAFIAISAPLDRARHEPEAAFAAIRKPILHITGVKDDSRFCQTTPADRRLPFAHAGGGDQYYLNLNEADHRVFAGPRSRGPQPHDQEIQDLVAGLGVAFWLAYLADDGQARAWLLGQAAADWLGGCGVWETRPAE